eukprot:1567291-Rhodomonas_salina.1
MAPTKVSSRFFCTHRSSQKTLFKCFFFFALGDIACMNMRRRGGRRRFREEDGWRRKGRKKDFTTRSTQSCIEPAPHIDVEATDLLKKSKALLDGDRLNSISWERKPAGGGDLKLRSKAESGREDRSSLPTRQPQPVSVPPRPLSDADLPRRPAGKENGEENNTRPVSREMRKGGPPTHWAEQEVVAYEDDLVNRILNAGGSSRNAESQARIDVPVPVSSTRLGRLWGSSPRYLMEYLPAHPQTASSCVEPDIERNREAEGEGKEGTLVCRAQRPPNELLPKRSVRKFLGWLVFSAGGRISDCQHLSALPAQKNRMVRDKRRKRGGRIERRGRGRGGGRRGEGREREGGRGGRASCLCSSFSHA